MIELFRNIRARIERVALARARAEARQRLLQMSDRNLADIGISRELLEQGVAAWPWQVGGEQAGPAIEPLSRKERAHAIRRLMALGDRDLADFGLAREDIVDAVTHGRGRDGRNNRRAAA